MLGNACSSQANTRFDIVIYKRFASSGIGICFGSAIISFAVAHLVISFRKANNSIAVASPIAPARAAISIEAGNF